MCVHVIIENTNETMDTNVISCVRTRFYSLLLRGELDKVRGLLLPNELCLGGTTTKLHTPDGRKASAKSSIWLIPCLDGKLKHWFLAVRMRMDKNAHKFLLVDSLGSHYAGSNRRRIVKALKIIVLMGSKDKWIRWCKLRWNVVHEC